MSNQSIAKINGVTFQFRSCGAIIVATDGSAYALTKASTMRYSPFSIDGSLVLLEKYKKGKWTLKEIL